MESTGYPALDISVLAGGTLGTRTWGEAIRAVARSLYTMRSQYATSLSLQVTFQIPGEVFQPDFSGVRTGAFSRRHRRLEVQVAVPGTFDGDKQEWIIAALREAIAEAKRFALMEALPDTDLSGLDRLIDAFVKEN